jgi:membrane peptidoglycan carboxypeptidase
MSNNYWQSQNNFSGSQEPGNTSRKSGLLTNYENQSSRAASSPVPPANHPAAGGPPPSSPLPSPPYQVPARPSRSFSPPQQWNGPAFIARPAQMVQRISQKMAALRRTGQAVDPNPLVRYRPPQPPAPPSTTPTPTRAAPWRRSRVQRITHLRKRHRERMQRNGPGSKRLRVIILSSIAALLLITIGSTAAYAYNFYQSELPQLQNLANMQGISQSTRIYDRHGTLLFTLYENKEWGLGGRSTPVSFNYLPKVLQDAQTAAEDPTFWTNNGIDPQGMLRALTEYVSHGGQVAGGGSTITQQLIKNLSGNKDISFQRKASEAALAIGLTQQYPKWKILEMYFNVTPYGAQEQGVEAAVEDYFGLTPQCNLATHSCIPAVAFLDRDLSQCKNPKDESSCVSDPILALARAALLAGIPQNPTHFDPSVQGTDNYQNVLTIRLPYVLNQMLADGMDLNLGLGSKDNDQGPITQDIISKVEAKAATIKIQGFRQTQQAPHFVQWVIKTLANQLGNYQDLDLNGISIPGARLLYTAGFNIYTTLDLNLEHFIEKDVKYNLTQPRYEPYTGYGPLNTVYNVNDSAVVVMDAKTGEVLAMDGSADYNNRSQAISGQVNAALAYRQPGSSIKPIIYATAFQMGWYPGIKLIDSKTYFPTGANLALPAEGHTYTPTDYMKSYHPKLPTDIRISLDNSFNIPAIKALMFAGLDNVIDMARRLGITAIDDDIAQFNRLYHTGTDPNSIFGPSFALGTAGIPLLQMTGAYQVFADNGVRVPYHNILDIYDNYGRNLYHYDPTHPNGTRVLSPQVAFLMNDILSDNNARRYEFSGIDTLTMSPWAPDRPVAAKTGTTDAFLDNWTLGYTSSIVVGVWSGNANGNNPMKNVIGVSGAGPIWQDVIEYASGHCQLGMCPDKAYPTNPFPVPSGVVQASVNPVNGLAGSGVTDWMIDGEQPSQSGLFCPSNTPNPNPNGDNGNGGNGQAQPPAQQGSCPTNGNGGQNGNNNGNGYGDTNGGQDGSGGDPFWNGNPFGN